MPRCISVGCTSGYNSNTEKVHFFRVPKNETSIELWKKALRRKNFKVKHGQTVCEKHFTTNDILKHREILGPDGSILGISSYKIPRLRKGAVPSIFPWIETESLRNIEQPITDERHEQHEDAPSPVGAFLNNVEEKCLADQLQGTLNMPPGWMNQSIQCGETILTHLYLQKCKRVNTFFKVSNLKEVFVTSDGSLQINVAGHTLDPSQCTFSLKISTRDELEDVLLTINNLNICQGFSLAPDVPSTTCHSINRDDDGCLRSVKCALLLSNSKVCQFCTETRNKIVRRLRRCKKPKYTQRLRLILSPKKRSQIQHLQSKYKSAVRAKNRAVSVREQLKSDLNECKKN
ncbi:uncharacterized protein [Venturia canescens]|uniref:uncharacterized protein n=1 Tax=Venturia canescens TaxID=32260 RepID=UPI001C9D2969|nr:uncharacterized protein LOC122408453 [Venturia canescens]